MSKKWFGKQLDPYYVSEYPTSPKRYFSEYVDAYLTVIGKPAIEVWSQRNFGESTAQGVRGAHDGTLGAGVTQGSPIADDRGQSWSMNGFASGNVIIPRHTDFDISTSESFTVFGTIQYTGGAGAKRIVSTYTGTTSDPGWLMWTTSSDALRAFVGDGTNSVDEDIVGSVLSDGLPHLCAFVLDRDTDQMRVVLDGVTGVAVDASAVTTPDNAMDISFGTDPDGGSPYTGLIGTGGFVRYALTDSELKHLYEACLDRTKRFLFDPLEELVPAIYADFTNESTLFTDTAGTTSVSSAGTDTVAAIRNRLTGNITATQASSGNRLTWTGTDVDSDGVNDYLISNKNCDFVHQTGKFTILSTMYIDPEIDAGQAIVGSEAGGADGYGFGAWFENRSSVSSPRALRFVMGSVGGSDYVQSVDDAITTEGWHTIAYVGDYDTMYFYADGELVSSTALNTTKQSPGEAATNAVHIGAAENALHHKGKFKNVVVTDTVMTADQIAAYHTRNLS